MKARLFYSIVFTALVLAIIYLFPWLFKQVVLWQREFNQLISGYLREIKQQPVYAGSLLIAVSFLYGVFHALGPGHGKFIIAGYLATHQTKLGRSMQITFFSSLTQGVVAISAVSIVVLLLQLSSAYFNLSQLWLERTAYALVILLGLNWCWKNGKTLLRQHRQTKKQLQIKKIEGGLVNEMRVGSLIAGKSAVGISGVFANGHTEHHENCGCGHQHMPNPEQLNQGTNIKESLLIILSIGMRPCSGAIFVLFMAYMLDLYAWGVIATLAMALGTGMTLSAFALLVRYARSTAVKMGQWYRLPFANVNMEALMKCLAGIILIFFAMGLLYGTTLPISGGAALFVR
ncbi:zinc transporter permease subunit ZevB [Aggregatibacter actinomycetemcomitans]|uniref:zinc transporter permease subunit ZevB n=1 Tax=Aggregatibacter actinomycetemcomitans TaxID=714 RepID=UPI00077E74C1|nr:zinc transporter permease subunit ZevB [Aggregatibacter actinomycetemcomitans]KYK72631.1 nickel/cobalt transporter [Aggregatibacter actinomycetemcomitans serotype e str. SA3096]TYB22263.1 zinc transporter permease subunit ZevB [Aggregatibacter actinomycetemcomitans]